MNQYKIIDDVLRNRRKQINLAFEGKDERMMAHLHTFINKFEEELKQKLALNHSQQVVKSGEELKEPSVKDLNRNQHADNSERDEFERTDASSVSALIEGTSQSDLISKKEDLESGFYDDGDSKVCIEYKEKREKEISSTIKKIEEALG